jgi:hypothetical protein
VGAMAGGVPRGAGRLRGAAEARLSRRRIHLTAAVPGV